MKRPLDLDREAAVTPGPGTSVRDPPNRRRGARRVSGGGEPAPERCARCEERFRTLYDQLRVLSSELALAEGRERRRIAAGLHDQVGQVLGVAKVELGRALATGPAADVGAAVAESRRLVEQAIREIRSLTFELSSPVLEELGLEAALRELAERARERYGLACDFESEAPVGPVAEDAAKLTTSIVRELMWNVVKHARARRAALTLARDGDRLRVAVRDDGVGFDARGAGETLRAGGGLGLFSARRRLEHLGGTLEIESAPGEGTRVVLALPLAAGTAGAPGTAVVEPAR